MTAILGLNAYHGDSSACLVVDGRLVAAAEEERFRRVKHWAGLPAEAVAWCLREGGLRLPDIAHIAVNTDPRAHLPKKLLHAVKSRTSPGFLLSRWRSRRKRLGLLAALGESGLDGFKGSVHYVEHHRAHLASAFLVSPFEEALAVSVDGFGDFASAAWGLGRGQQVRPEGYVLFPHSLGIFYETITRLLGFPNYGDEYKVMGLAPYGEPVLLPQMRKIVRLERDGSFALDLRYFIHHRVGQQVSYTWDGGEPKLAPLYSPALLELLGPVRRSEEPLTQHHKDIARSAQAMYEEAFFHLLNALHARYRCDRLALAGGCAMNSVANGKVTLRTPFKELYVQAAAGDAGGAMGAAFAVSASLNPALPRFSMQHANWGPAAAGEELAALIQQNRATLDARHCRVTQMPDEAALCARTAEATARGEVVGWFQGRMEWGPRALGNRSIVCDPRRADMKDILNQKIKRRESFRPFAPSVLREAVSEWFELDGEVPFMTQVYPIRADQRARIPAVTHVDGSGRLQTVRQDANPRYYRLIETFGRMTGVPMVLNTSFNENEPVVCRPQEALDCFLRTEMDVLVLGDYVIERQTRG